MRIGGLLVERYVLSPPFIEKALVVLASHEKKVAFVTETGQKRKQFPVFCLAVMSLE